MHLPLQQIYNCENFCAGKAVMYLYRHPRETKENKLTAGHIIHTWARPIFHKEDNPANLSKEDRREKDAAIAARNVKRKRSAVDDDAKRPGDPGWVGRARVPQAGRLPSKFLLQHLPVELFLPSKACSILCSSFVTHFFNNC